MITFGKASSGGKCTLFHHSDKRSHQRHDRSGQSWRSLRGNERVSLILITPEAWEAGSKSPLNYTVFVLSALFKGGLQLHRPSGVGVPSSHKHIDRWTVDGLEDLG